MTFGLADVAANLPQGTPGGNDTEEGVVKSLALKVLQVLLFSGAQLQYLEFDPTVVLSNGRQDHAGQGCCTCPRIHGSHASREG